MRAIILAAGRGSRLAEQQPKCLLQFGGRSLLARHLDILHAHGVRQADLVIGYQADSIIEHVGQLSSRPDVAFHFNPRYEQGSVVSLMAASASLTSGNEILLMDADVLYHPRIMTRLLESPHANCFLLDRNFQAGEEPVKIAVRGAEILEFCKLLDDGLRYDFLGESVGFFRFEPECASAIAAECARFDAEGMNDAPHEEVLRNLLLGNPASFGWEEITGLPWIEIDFPEDVTRARQEILPSIRTDIAGF